LPVVSPDCTYHKRGGLRRQYCINRNPVNTNEAMRVLTIIVTIFIPLTFIVGVYGMNFDRTAGAWNMPEPGWPYGYLLVWLVMVVIAVLMLLFFRRRKLF